jgi:hypothetical protein
VFNEHLEAASRVGDSPSELCAASGRLLLMAYPLT